jgi:hypothetical protein
MHIQVNPNLLPLIRLNYTQDLEERLQQGQFSEREKLVAALNAIDQEEARTVRLLAVGKLSEEVWDALWVEWQDRRIRLLASIAASSQQQKHHVENLESALQIVAKVGTLYNQLDSNSQKELLHHVVKKVFVNAEGQVELELRTPFAYLRSLSDDLRCECKNASTNKTSNTFKDVGCSDCFQSLWGTWIRTKISTSRVYGSAVELSPNLNM